VNLSHGIDGVLDSRLPGVLVPATYARAIDIPVATATVVPLIFCGSTAHGESGFVRKAI
jgi:hypothetical protein